MRYLAVGDLHIDKNNRFEDFKKTLDQIADIAIEKNVDKVLFLGDAFTNRRPYPEEYKVLYDWVVKIAGIDKANECWSNEGDANYYREVILLRGNHDQQRDASTLDAFDILSVPGVKVVDTNHIEDGIFMGHFIIKEAVFGNSDFHIEDAITVEQLTTRYPEVKLFLMGDIHKPQQVNENPPIYYVGSIDRNNFGERDNEPRVLLINTKLREEYKEGDKNAPEKDEYSIESIPLKVRLMRQFDFNIDDTTDMKTKDELGMWVTQVKVTDAIIKLVIHGTEENLKKIEMDVLREMFKTAHSLVIQYDIIRKDLVRDVTVTQEMSDEAVLSKYLEEKREDLTNQEKETVFCMGKEIIQKSKEK